MTGIQRKGVEEARSQLPDILNAAENGQVTIITRHGRAVAAVMPMSTYQATARQQPITPLAGSGRGLWDKKTARTTAKLRDEWDR